MKKLEKLRFSISKFLIFSFKFMLSSLSCFSILNHIINLTYFYLNLTHNRNISISHFSQIIIGFSLLANQPKTIEMTGLNVRMRANNPNIFGIKLILKIFLSFIECIKS